MENIPSAGGLDEALQTIIDTCREQGVPFVFALSRKVLGRCVNKAVPVSLVGIFNYDGAQVRVMFTELAQNKTRPSVLL